MVKRTLVLKSLFFSFLLAACGKNIPQYDRPIYQIDSLGKKLRYKEDQIVIDVESERAHGAVCFMNNEDEDDFQRFVEMYILSCNDWDTKSFSIQK